MDRTLCQMEFDPKLLELLRARAIRNRIMGPLMANAKANCVCFAAQQGIHFPQFLSALIGQAGAQAYDPLRHSDYYR